MGFFREQPPALFWAGLVLAFAGTLSILGPEAQTQELSQWQAQELSQGPTQELMQAQRLLVLKHFPANPK